MCFCDGYNFLVINKNTGEKHFIQGDENLIEFFLKHNGTLYRVSYNSHPDCQRVKMQLVKELGVEDPGLWRICPKEYRHLLHDERRQELNKTKETV